MVEVLTRKVVETNDNEFYVDLVEQLGFWGIVYQPDDRISPQNVGNSRSIKEIVKSGILTMAAAPFGEPFSDMIDPFELSTDSPFHDLITFPPVIRMFGVGQLGIQRILPFPNFTSRGQHVVQVGLEALKMAIKHKLPRKDQLMAFVGGVMHDLHPAFGEAGKIAMGVSEPDLIEYYFEDRYKSFWQNWLLRIRSDFAVDISFEELRSYITGVITRQNKTLPGKLGHGPNKSELDLDFWVYTVIDANIYPILLLSTDQSLIDIELDDPDFIRRMERLKKMLTIFSDLEDYHASDRIFMSLRELDIRPHITMIDGQLVVTDHICLEKLFRLSAVLFTDYYLNPNVLGPEIMFATIINQNPNMYPTLHDFVELNDQEFFERIQHTQLAEWIVQSDRHRGWRYVDADHLQRYRPGEYLIVESRLPQINLRLSTRVMNERGQIAPWLQMYYERASFLRHIESLSGEPIFLVWKK